MLQIKAIASQTANNHASVAITSTPTLVVEVSRQSRIAAVPDVGRSAAGLCPDRRVDFDDDIVAAPHQSSLTASPPQQIDSTRWIVAGLSVAAIHVGWWGSSESEADEPAPSLAR